MRNALATVPLGTTDMAITRVGFDAWVVPSLSGCVETPRSPGLPVRA